ncbi:MAG: efflux RND transporter periplasmic adaptor subunit [Deltaproteobacteria bacterium]|nr:efflux RND transporter periplasmic adaptor subunit [Deltaproteobacteria bacterium]
MEREKKRKGKLGLVVAAIAILVFGAITAYNYWTFKTRKKKKKKKEIVVPVETEPARYMDLAWDLEQMGDLRPLGEVYVSPKIPGKIIEKILVEKGDFVRKGDLIAVLEKDIILAQIREAKAGLAAAKARLKEVEANLDVIRKDRVRLGKLVKSHAVSQQKMDQIEARFEAAQASRKLAMAQVEKAKSSLNLLDILLKDHDVRAPISGYISARYMDAGAMSDTKKPIVRVSDESVIKIVTTVTEQDYPHIRKGMEAEIRVDAFPEKVFKGSVSIINPTLDPATRTGLIEIHVPNKNLLLRSGMYSHIRLHLGNRRALVISKDGLNRLPGTGSYYCFVVRKDRAILKNIVVGLTQGDRAEVKEGLKAGEEVVIKGKNRLQDGTMVKRQASGVRKGSGMRKEEGGRGGTK